MAESRLVVARGQRVGWGLTTKGFGERQGWGGGDGDGL